MTIKNHALGQEISEALCMSKISPDEKMALYVKLKSQMEHIRNHPENYGGEVITITMDGIDYKQGSDAMFRAEVIAAVKDELRKDITKETAPASNTNPLFGSW